MVIPGSRRIWPIVPAALALSCALAVGTRADWVQVGGSLNNDPNVNAVAPSMAMVGTAPWVTWTEPNSGASRIYVKYWNGSAWTAAGGPIYVNAALGPYYSNLGVSGGTTPSVGWIEYNYVNPPTLGYMRTWTGSSWGAATPAFNTDLTGGTANSPTIAYSGATPYVAFTESSVLHVRTYNGTAWSNVGAASLNAVNTYTAYGGRIAFNGTNLYVTWQELGAPFANWQTYVRRYVGGVWSLVGEALSPYGIDASSPDLAFAGTTPYVAYCERNTSTNRYEIAVKYWGGPPGRRWEAAWR